MNYRDALGKFPSLYCAAVRCRPGRTRRVVGSRTDLVVESYPRSGATFLVTALELSSPEVSVASHVHHIAHIRRATQLGIPQVVIVRPPMDSVLSLMVFRGDVQPLPYLERWNDFHADLLNSNSASIIRFETLIRSVATVVTVALSFIGASASIEYDDSSLNEKTISEVRRRSLAQRGNVSNRKVGVPTEEREAMKCELRSTISTIADSEPGKHAVQLYQQLLATSIM